jgi:hypothetical protein
MIQGPQRTIAIILGDNDFGNTCGQLLESIYRAWVCNDGKLSEYQIKESLEAGLEFHYRLFQSFDGNLHSQTKRYLNSNVTVLFDEDAEKDIAANDYDSGAWYLELQTGCVYSY